MRKIVLFLLVAVLVLGFTLPGIAEEEKLPKQLSFASKPLGEYYVMTAGFARVVEKKAGIKVTVETAPSQYAYMPFFKKQETQLAILGSFYVYQAYHGLGKFEKQGKTPLAYLATGHIQPFMLWTRPDTGIKTAKDMTGKIVTTKNPASELFEEFVSMSLKTAGVWDKVKHVTRPASNSETCQMLIEKKYDVISMPLNPQLLEVEKAVGLVPIGPGHEAIKELIKSPYWAEFTVPAGKFAVKEPIKTTGFVTCTFTYKDLPDNIAYLLVKTAFENLDELTRVYRLFKQWSPKTAVESIPIPMHPGAIKYYKEKGVWTSEQEAVQKKLLAAGQ
jgi:TRAP transporter TAXI family solute receptor